MSSWRTSARLRAAVVRELEVIAKQRARLDTRREKIERELEALQEEDAGLELRAEFVDQLLAQDGPSDEQPGDRRTGIVLRGASIREVAIRILYEQRGCLKIVHYKEWLAMLRDAGYVVLGAKPAATFLTNVMRSPFVFRGDEPGTYMIDDRVEGRLRQQLVEHQAELADVCEVIARTGGSQAERVHRASLNAHVRVLERQVADAEAAFAPLQSRQTNDTETTTTKATT